MRYYRVLESNLHVPLLVAGSAISHWVNKSVSSIVDRLGLNQHVLN